MFRISDLLDKIRKPADALKQGVSEMTSDRQKIKNWYEERYDTMLVQRNLLMLLLLLLLALSIVSVVVVAYVINAKKFDPFVIQIDDSTGQAQIVNPVSQDVLLANESLSKYFIKKYVTARETYNPVDFDTEAQKTIRLLSTNSIYWTYKSYIKKPEINPVTKYGQKNTTYLTVKSWSKLEDKKYILRFSVNETAGGKVSHNKLALVQFNYLPMELTESDRDVNPIGFQVIGYRVDDDNS